MHGTSQSFAEFEHTGWEDPSTVTAYDRQLSLVTTQCIGPLLDDARVAAGSRLLDIATGAGYVAAAAAARGASATGIDFSRTQVDMARARYPRVTFQEADAEALPFDAGTFDVVVNAYGTCHLPDPDKALREAFRVLEPGGRIAFSVWDVPERAIGFGAVYAAIRAHGALDVGLPAGPNFFLFSDPDYSIQALHRAGFQSAACRQVPQWWRVADPDELFGVVTTATVRAAATLRAQTPAALEAIRAAVHQTVERYRDGDGFAVPMPAVIASAIKP